MCYIYLPHQWHPTFSSSSYSSGNIRSALTQEVIIGCSLSQSYDQEGWEKVIRGNFNFYNILRGLYEIIEHIYHTYLSNAWNCLSLAGLWRQMSVDDDLAAFSQNNLPKPILTFDSIIHSLQKQLTPVVTNFLVIPPYKNGQHLSCP